VHLLLLSSDATHFNLLKVIDALYFALGLGKAA
jgi:hypothetical protein